MIATVNVNGNILKVSIGAGRQSFKWLVNRIGYFYLSH